MVSATLSEGFLVYSAFALLVVFTLSDARFWDDWMRQPAQRLERACIRPEIPRTSTFGKIGVSKLVELLYCFHLLAGRSNVIVYAVGCLCDFVHCGQMWQPK